MLKATKLLAKEKSHVTFSNGTRVASPFAATVTQSVPATGRRSSTNRLRSPVDRDTRPWFDAALAEAGMLEQETIEVDLEPSDRARIVGAGDHVVVRPAPARGGIQVILYVDESGGMSWHLPDGSTKPGKTRGVNPSARANRFTIDARTDAAQRSFLAQRGGSVLRGPITKIGRKIFKVLVLPIAEAMLSRPAKAILAAIERKHRQDLVRAVTPENYRKPETKAFTNWAKLVSGRSLLVVHGIFSTTEGMLAQLSPTAMEELNSLYEGRIIGLDQLTASRSPEENARFFLRRVSDAAVGESLEFDILSHSRGGIVARLLAERGRQLDPSANALFRNVYFVATPNQGSALADPEHIVDMIDVFTNLATDFPDGPVAYAMETLLGVIKIVAATAEHSFPGLAAMGTEGSILQLNDTKSPSLATYAAAGSDYEPDPEHDNGFFTGRFANYIVDKVFEIDRTRVANDLVVPRDGVFAENGHPSFPIVRRLTFETSDRVWHSGFFSRAQTVRHVLEFFGERDRTVAIGEVGEMAMAPPPPPSPRRRLSRKRTQTFGGLFGTLRGAVGVGGGGLGGGGGGGFGGGISRSIEASVAEDQGDEDASFSTPQRGRTALSSAAPGAGKSSPKGRKRAGSRRRARKGRVRLARSRLSRKGAGRPHALSVPSKPDITVTRDPHIDFHELVFAGKTLPLVVRLSEAVAPADLDTVMSIVIARGRDTVELKVSLSAPGFDVKPRREQKLIVGRNFDKEKESVTFQLTARNPGPRLVTREIRADIWLDNSPLGAVIHRTNVAGAGYKGSLSGDGSSRSSPLVLDEPRQDCELIIRVEGVNDDGRPPFRISLRGAIPGEEPYETRAVGRLEFPRQEFESIMKDQITESVFEYPEDGSGKDVARWKESLIGAIDTLGKWLWTRLPEAFQKEYFRLHDAGLLPASIQIHSDEMIIPWELIVPHRTDGKPRVMQPLGVAHVMGRWRPGLGIKPSPQRMRVDVGCIMNPKYAGSDQLIWSILEAAELRKLVPAFSIISPVDHASVKRLLSRADIQILHYSGHAEYAKHADLSTLRLEGGGKFTAMEFVAANLLGAGKPIIYLNACEAGRTGVVMGQMGGFAATCITNGCSGIIAPYWAIADSSAKEFSVAFYEKVMRGRSIGEALQELRRDNSTDPTFQAFAYFGDPWTRPQLVPGRASKAPRRGRRTRARKIT